MIAHTHALVCCGPGGAALVATGTMLDVEAWEAWAADSRRASAGVYCIETLGTGERRRLVQARAR